MKSDMLVTLALTFLLVAPLPSSAQQKESSQATQQKDQKSIASTLAVYVFPNAGQDASQQSKDEGECYDWAVDNSGVDPFALQKQTQQQQQASEQSKQQAAQSGRGAGVKGAAGGAAAGAIIGEIADDDAGKGAAIGGAVGAVAARRRAKASQKQATEQIDAQARKSQQVSSEQMSNFKKAFSVCLEARKYMVKY